ncbi:MAG: hypothetical protein R3Y11_11775, partial [Pseudomonadota bacterium]
PDPPSLSKTFICGWSWSLRTPFVATRGSEKDGTLVLLTVFLEKMKDITWFGGFDCSSIYIDRAFLLIAGGSLVLARREDDVPSS